MSCGKCSCWHFKKAVHAVQFLNSMNELDFHLSTYLSVHIHFLCFQMVNWPLCVHLPQAILCRFVAWVFPVVRVEAFAIPERKGFSLWNTNNLLASLAFSNLPKSCEGMPVAPGKFSVPFICCRIGNRMQVQDKVKAKTCISSPASLQLRT